MANGSLQIAKLFGIPVLLHWTFGLLFFYVLYIGQREGLDTHQVLWLGLFVIAMFICIVMHEFGHALTARRYGVETQDIILLPIGGVARLVNLPEKPLQEFFVAIAGPLVNVGIALLLSPVFFFHTLPGLVNRKVLNEADIVGDYFFFIPALIFLNIMLAVFNLLPAFPMDGGRILRSLLAVKIGRYKATRFAAFMGQGIAALLFFYGLWEGSFTTAFIGIFIFFTAMQEYRWVRTETFLARFSIRDVFRPVYTRLRTYDKMQSAIELVMRNVEHNFLVFNENNQLAGTLSRQEILTAAQQERNEFAVMEFMDPHLMHATINDSLKEVHIKMQRAGIRITPVYENGELVGVLDAAMIRNFLAVQKRMGERA
jgi:Zn-dependent protease/CBS domain-containing protein